MFLLIVFGIRSQPWVSTGAKIYFSSKLIDYRFLTILEDLYTWPCLRDLLCEYIWGKFCSFRFDLNFNMFQFDSLTRARCIRNCSLCHFHQNLLADCSLNFFCLKILISLLYKRARKFSLIFYTIKIPREALFLDCIVVQNLTIVFQHVIGAEPFLSNSNINSKQWNRSISTD